MTAPTTLPPADELPGVAAGWWVTGVKHAARTAHRLTTSLYKGKSNLAVCGRTLHSFRQASEAATVCETCTTKAGRLAPRPDDTPAPPPPSPRRIPAAATAPQDNTAAARAARRAAFTGMFASSARSQDYVQRQYGLDDAAREAASLRRTP